MPNITNLQTDYDRSFSFGWTPSFYTGGTVRRPYAIAGPPRSRRVMRRRYKRGGRFKKKSRRACLLGMRPEKKFVDLALTSDPTVTGAVSLLSAVVQGDTESQRIGRKIIVTDILIKGHLKLAGGANSATANRIRLAVVWDKQSNGASMTAGLVWNTAGTADINSYRDLSHVGRFVILHDKVHTMMMPLSGNGTTDQSGDAMRDVHISIKCCIPIEFDASATTGAITTQQVNSLHFVAFEEATGPTTELQLNSRLRYVD